MAINLSELRGRATGAVGNMSAGGGLKTVVIGILVVVVIYLVYQLIFLHRLTYFLYCFKLSIL